MRRTSFHQGVQLTARGELCRLYCQVLILHFPGSPSGNLGNLGDLLRLRPLCLQKYRVFAALIRPLLTQMTFIGYEGAVNFKHFEVRFVSLMADNIMSNMGALVNSTTPYDEGWLRARWFDELKSICIWPVNIRQRASDWEREHSKGLRSPAISLHPTQTPAPNGKRAKISHTGSGLSKSAANNHPSPQSNPSPRATRTSSPAVAQEICRNELYHQLNITSKGCSTAHCNRNHFELTKLAKPTLVAACEAPPPHTQP